MSPDTELERMIRENNAMLKRICAYIDKVDSPQYKDARDFEAFLSNIVADLWVDNNQRQERLNSNNQQYY